MKFEKGQSGNPGGRPRKAASFEDDLRAFLQNQPTVAEAQHEPAWESNETLEDRVVQRTQELTALNAELAEARLRPNVPTMRRRASSRRHRTTSCNR